MASDVQQEPIAANSEVKEQLEYPSSADAYILLSEIGRGAFATVYRAKLKIRHEEVAVKILDLEELNTNWDEIRKDIQIMRSMQHPNVVPVYTAFVEEEELWIVMPLLAAGSCANIMKQLYPHGIKDEGVIAYILFEVLKGLQYFHKNDKIHRDVKAGNILLSRHGEVQLADFGVAGTLMENGDRKKNRSTFVGTPCWMAPEVMEQSRGYNSKADIWSFGITAMELGYGRAPYATYPPMKVLLMTMQEDPPTCEIYKDPFRFSRHFQDMISKCLRKDISRRYSAEKLMKHKFFEHMAPVSHVIEKLIRPLPPLEGDPNNPVLRKKRSAAEHAARKPISVESWIFDDPEAMKKLDAGTSQTGDHVAVIINFSGPLPQPTTQTVVEDDDETPPSSSDGPTLKNYLANAASEPQSAPVLNRDSSEPLISFSHSSAASSSAAASSSPFLSSSAVHGAPPPPSSSSLSNLLNSSPLLNSAAATPGLPSPSLTLSTNAPPIQPAVTQSAVVIPSSSSAFTGASSVSSQNVTPIMSSMAAPDAQASALGQAPVGHSGVPQSSVISMTPSEPQPQYAYQPQMQPQPISQQPQSMYAVPPFQSLVFTQAPPTHSSQFVQQLPPNFNFASLSPEQQQLYLAQQQQQQPPQQTGQSAPVKEEKKGRFLVREE